jgi:putative transposase
VKRGMLYRLGIEVQHCIKYHPQSKHIESFFRTLHMRFDSLFAHYTTGNAYARPDETNHRDGRTREAAA